MPLPTELIRRGDRRRVPWKNGAGVTDEIAVDATVAPRWRVSVADLGDAATEFSAFEGRSRVFTVIGAYGVTFEWRGGTTAIEPLQPFGFDGERTPRCIPDGTTSAFNVMVDRRTTTASVSVHDLVDSTVDTDIHAVTVFYVHSGRVEAGSRSADAGDCIVIRLDSVEIRGTGKVLIAEIRDRPIPG
ncbi:HutD family protein [Rhodococcus sp. KBS0724]|uniref:HutD/Ves family protein n=1 Tax=Rhodococcus sp. KBS0724 TaxID=1179674 RepID=UPI00163DA827|nr:HutD family protein [Rhodococcus sp. KBS0724]